MSKAMNEHLSPGLGIRETKASQSKREVIFNKMAKIMGLGNYFPRAELIYLDGEEVAVLEFFSASSFTTADKLKRDHSLELKGIFEQMVGNGLLFKFTILDYIGGNVDRHAGNVLVNLDTKDIKFIDSGSTLAGHSFNPAKDVKSSFSPFYLRIFVSNWKVLTPQERFEKMPSVNQETEQAFKFWVENVNEGQIVNLFNEYGVDSQAIVDRLRKIKEYSGPKTEYLKKFFAGVDV